MPDLESATTKLYEEASLTEDLIDEEATTLLKWAEAQIPVMLEKHTDETAFDEAFTALRAFVKSVNRVIGQGETMDDAEKQERMAKIAQSASALGYPVEPQPTTDFSAQAARQPEQNNVGAIKALLDWVASSRPAPRPSPQLQSAADLDALPPPSPQPSQPAPAHHSRTLKEFTNDEEDQF